MDIDGMLAWGINLDGAGECGVCGPTYTTQRFQRLRCEAIEAESLPRAGWDDGGGGRASLAVPHLGVTLLLLLPIRELTEFFHGQVFSFLLG